MSTTATKVPPTYLKSARLDAGYANRDTASTVVPFSPETIGRHERGEVALTQEDALVYAKSYNRSEIFVRYCGQCPIGQAMGRRAIERDLPFAAMRFTRRIRETARNIVDKLEAIADDGIVDETERGEFTEMLAMIYDLGETISDILLYAAEQGMEMPVNPLR